MKRQHLDCDCVPRLLVPVEDSAHCDTCRRLVQFPDWLLRGVPMPTTAPVGSLAESYSGCAWCDGEVKVICEVRAL